MSQPEFKIDTASDLYEAIRRGLYDARKACNPNYPTLRNLLTPSNADLLLADRADLLARNAKQLDTIERLERDLSIRSTPAEVDQLLSTIERLERELSQSRCALDEVARLHKEAGA